jgi:hypothetical protein
MAFGLMMIIMETDMHQHSSLLDVLNYFSSFVWSIQFCQSMSLTYLQLISESLQAIAITLQNKLNKCKAVWLLKNNKCGYRWLDIPLWVLPTETNLLQNQKEKGKPEPGSWKSVFTFLITNICSAIIKSTAPYSHLFPWSYTCSTRHN